MEVPKARCIVLCLFFDSSFSFQFDSSLTFNCEFTIKERPKLNSRYKECVQAATEYVKMIDNFDDLVDPETLAHNFLGLEPSCALLRSKRSEFFFEFFLFFFCFCFFFCF